jgi:hypothetical protein
MTAKVLEGFSGKLSEQWAATLLTPAFAFWAGGFAAAIQRFGWKSIVAAYQPLPEPLQIGILVLGLCLVAASAFIAQRFDTEIIRLLEGYWYPPFRFLLTPFKQAQIRRKTKLEKQWQKLNKTRNAEFIECDRALHQYPDRDEDILPFSLGNILRAAERRPADRYGLDPIICWPRLWILLPDGAKKEISEAYIDLASNARLWLWSLLFLVWSPWVWWAIPIAILSASFAYSRSQDAASSYGDLIESAFDLHRSLLYKSLRFPLPETSDQEPDAGLQITEYLWRGTRSAAIRFSNLT